MSSAVMSGQCVAHSVGAVNTMVSAVLQAMLAAQCAVSPPELWPKDHADEALKNGLGTYDFVVLGAGSAGSVIASRLSENPAWKVLVLESGDNPPDESETPYLFSTVPHTTAAWNYFGEPSDNSCKGSINGRCYLPRGRIIGGTGGINGMLYLRGNRRDFDTWKQFGNQGWGWDEVLPFFKRSVQPVGTDADPKGYVVLNHFPIINKNIEEMVLKGAAELGQKTVREINEGSDVGYAEVSGTYQDGRRMSTGKTYLAKVSHRPNLHVIKNANVTKLNFDKTGKKVRSVSFILRGKKQMEATIGNEVIMSLGAIGSPQALMLSGVGPAAHLKEMGIPLVRDLPVGDNFQDHLLVTHFLKLNENVAKPLTREESLDKIYNNFIHRTGAYATVDMNTVVGYVNTAKNGPYPDVEYHHFYFRRGDVSAMRVFVTAFGYNPAMVEQMYKAQETSDTLVILNVLLNPKSIGNLRLRSKNYQDPPKITLNYLNDKEDEATLLRSIRYQEQLLNTAAYKSMNAKLVLPDLKECDAHKRQSDDYWRCYFKYFGSSGFHFTGTVKMAPETDKTGCVNPRLKLKGFDNLRVADASIMPKIPSGNTNAPTIMIAEKAVDFIREDWKNKKGAPVNSVPGKKGKKENKAKGKNPKGK